MNDLNFHFSIFNRRRNNNGSGVDFYYGEINDEDDNNYKERINMGGKKKNRIIDHDEEKKNNDIKMLNICNDDIYNSLFGNVQFFSGGYDNVIGIKYNVGYDHLLPLFMSGSFPSEMSGFTYCLISDRVHTSLVSDIRKTASQSFAHMLLFSKFFGDIFRFGKDVIEGIVLL
jgi:hypothetical protein